MSDPLEHSGLGVMDSMSDLDPLERSALITALDGRPMAGITVLEPLEHLVLVVDMYPQWMAPWDAGGTFRIGSRPKMAIRRDILCCVVRLSCRPVFPAVGYLGYFGGLARTCVIDLYTGVSTTLVEMLVEDNQMDFPRLQFPPVGMEVWHRSALITALDGRPMAGITVLEPLEHSVLVVDMDSQWMAPWDAGGTFRIGSRPKMAIRRDILCCVVRLSCRPVFPAAGYLGYFGGLARTCVIDLYTGVSTTLVEMLVEDNQMDFPRLQFPPVDMEVWPSTSVTLPSEDSRGRGCEGHGYSPGDSSMTDLGFPRASCTPVEMCPVELNFPRARFPPGETCAEKLAI